MAEVNKSDFKFDNYIIRHSEHNIKREKLDADSLSLEINPKGVKYNDKFILTLDIIVKDDAGNFDLKIIVDGYFRFRENIPVDQLSKYFIINAPAIIFPYIRGYISMLTSLSGIGNITLPVLNLTKLSKELATHIEERN